MAFNLGDALRGVSDLGTGREQIEYIRMDLIDDDPQNFYALTGIDELAANIELCGLQQPIRVRPIPDSDRYMIVSGHRRRKAVAQLAQDDPERWSEIPCIVERGAVSPALQQLRLIYANASTRKMTDAETAEQAAQVEKLLYELKEAGYEFPGRMRDHVAEAVGKSKSKLARLKVIREKLAFCWQNAWKEGSLPESVAYALAQVSPSWQQLIFDGGAGKNPRTLYEGTVREYINRFEKIAKAQCDAGGRDVVCSHKLEMMKKSCMDRWSSPCASSCCLKCSSLRTCKTSCYRADAKKTELRESYKLGVQKQTQQAEERDRPILDTIRAVYARVGEARAASGISVAELYKAGNRVYCDSDVEKQCRLENGSAKISTNTTLPFGHSFYANDVKNLIGVADLLQVSLDYLLCRTDIREMAQDLPVPESDTSCDAPVPGAWYPASVEPPVGVELVLIDSGGFTDTGKYMGFGEYTMDYGDPVVMWSLMPQLQDLASTAPAAPAGTGWRTGTPETPGYYAAYVKINGVAKPMLRELQWTGLWWVMCKERISDDVTVSCWAAAPEV